MLHECEGLGHYASECPTRIEREITPTRQREGIGPNVRNVQGRRAKSPRSRERVRIRDNLKIRETVAGRESRQLFPP